jgi:cytochrome c553
MEHLAGKSAMEIYEELLEMSKKPANTDVMHVQARGYTDAQMRLIADYFSQLPKAR